MRKTVFSGKLLKNLRNQENKKRSKSAKPWQTNNSRASWGIMINRKIQFAGKYWLPVKSGIYFYRTEISISPNILKYLLKNTVLFFGYYVFLQQYINTKTRQCIPNNKHIKHVKVYTFKFLRSQYYLDLDHIYLA